MRRKPPTDLAASVRQRLLNLARARGEELQLVLTRYGVERLLYRLGRTTGGERFVLKGAVLFYLWVSLAVQRIGALVLPAARATTDAQPFRASWTPAGGWVREHGASGDEA